MPREAKEKNIEREYKRLFTYQTLQAPTVQTVTDQRSLEQPHGGKIIQTVTTYAAYEEPI
ncbi:MAG: hypothetical protein ACREBU_21310 [Nitrososphaera sp.]